MESQLIPGPGQEIHKVSLEHLVVPKSKEVLTKMKTKNPQDDGGRSKGAEKAPNDRSWNNLNNKMK